MRYLIHSSLAITSARAILYDEAEKLVHQGHEVYFAYCDNLLDLCFINTLGIEAECIICQKNYLYEKKLLTKKINFISLRKEMKKANKRHALDLSVYNYQSLEDIKRIKYRDVNIGYACLSSYITATRNLSPLIDEQFRIYFNALIENCIKLCDVINQIIDEIKPDAIIFFNGRLMENRPLWEIAKQKKINFYSYEMVKKLNSLAKSVYKNSTPHSIDNTTKIIEDFWNQLDIPLNEKMDIGKSFFERRRNAQYTGDKIYIENQKTGTLPKEFDENKHNVVIFNSSEDEFAAIGHEFEQYSLFSTQVNGLGTIFDHFSQNSKIHFYLRIHPNLKGIKYKYHTELYEFDRYNNVTVIAADSDLSSYSLLDVSDTVIVFGSTMGIESVYWGKPAILLNGADYYHLKCCYIPKTVNELFSLITEDLEPMESIQAIKYGYYLLNTNQGKPSHIDFNYSYKKLKLFSFEKEIGINNWLKIMGSRTFYTVFRYSIDKIIKSLFRKVKYSLPIKER